MENEQNQQNLGQGVVHQQHAREQLNSGIETSSLGTENQPIGVDYNHLLFLSPADVSGIQIISFQLTGIENYCIWNRPMRVALLGRNKLGLIDGTCKKEKFPEILWNHWERVIAIVLSWSMNSVSKNLLGGITYASCAQVVWEDLFERFNKDIWEEFEALVPAPGCDFPKSKDFVVYLQTLKLYQFLMGLNGSYAQARSQILMRSHVPTVNQAYAVIMSDEAQKSIASSTGILGTNPAMMTRNFDGHSKENCYKIVGYPPNYRPKKKGGAGNNAALSLQTIQHNRHTMIGCTFFREQYHQILQLLNRTGTSQSSSIMSTPAANAAGISCAMMSEKPKKIFMPNGDISYVTHTGDSTISEGNTELFSEKVRAIGREDDGLYILERQAFRTSLVVTDGIKNKDQTISTTAKDIDLWHKRFGHVSTTILKKLLHSKVELIADTVKQCVVCPCAKQTRLPFPISSIKTESRFDLVCMNLWGPYKTPTYDGNKFFLTVVDDFSRMTWVFLLKQKSEVRVLLQQFLVLVKTQFDKIIRVIRTDNGTEFINSVCSEMFKKLGIIHQTSCAYTPQQNGVAERKHRHILEITRAIRFQAKIPIRFWGHCVNAAVYLINRIPSVVINNKTPYEKLYHKTPSYSHLKNIQCSVPQCVLAHDQISVQIPSDTVEPELNHTLETIQELPQGYEEFDNQTIDNTAQEFQDLRTEMPSTEFTLITDPLVQSGHRRSDRKKIPPIWLSDFVSLNIHQKVPYSISKYITYEGLSPAYQAYIATSSSVIEPTTYSEAAKDPRWIEAMKAEIDALQSNHTWDIVSLPEGKIPIGCKWIYKVKYKATGEIERFKARLVAKGYSQKEGIDYQETFSPVIKMKTVRTVLPVAAGKKWHIHQMDVYNAFLQGDLYDEIYMELPQGFKSQGKKKPVCRLIKSLYGLKQAPKQWNAKLTEALIKSELEQNQFDHSLFIKKTSEGTTMVLVYVDDMLITGDSLSLIEET
ncbi:PREDICTED: uncharacterized protein LOC109212029 [Nicotiana attenuata]|uniref:uncharacterized protein LOC109212029 n=1 Tax=Nicotiana attenuata TaxID=49451 RepID=UPI0009057851|nr:PREDICTED: uncharacterized protein LOC109212029 [Nicotiana attenuata]